jgi:hypothetical protein
VDLLVVHLFLLLALKIVRSTTGGQGTLVVLPEQLNYAGYLGGRPHWGGDPARIGQNVVWSRPPYLDKLVAQQPREREVGNGPVEMSQLAAPEPELEATEAVFMGRNPLPGRDLSAHRLNRRERGRDLAADIAEGFGCENHVFQ